MGLETKLMHFASVNITARGTTDSPWVYVVLFHSHRKGIGALSRSNFETYPINEKFNKNLEEVNCYRKDELPENVKHSFQLFFGYL